MCCWILSDVLLCLVVCFLWFGSLQVASLVSLRIFSQENEATRAMDDPHYMVGSYCTCTFKLHQLLWPPSTVARLAAAVCHLMVAATFALCSFMTTLCFFPMLVRPADLVTVLKHDFSLCCGVEFNAFPLSLWLCVLCARVDYSVLSLRMWL